MQIHLAWNTTSITFYNSTLEAPSWEFQYYVVGFIVHAATKCDKDSQDKWEQGAGWEEAETEQGSETESSSGQSFYLASAHKNISDFFKASWTTCAKGNKLGCLCWASLCRPTSLLLLLLCRTMGNNHWFMAVILVIKLELLASKSVPAAVRW